MRFHIIITDNETGETMHDLDACAILASINAGDRVRNVHAINCNASDYAETLNGVQNIVYDVVTEHPRVATLAAIISAEEPEVEETETKNEE